MKYFHIKYKVPYGYYFLYMEAENKENAEVKFKLLWTNATILDISEVTEAEFDRKKK